MLLSLNSKNFCCTCRDLLLQFTRHVLVLNTGHVLDILMVRGYVGKAKFMHIEKYLIHMEESTKIKIEVYCYLNQIEKTTWPRSYFSGHSKIDLIVNNLSVSFNSTIYLKLIPS